MLNGLPTRILPLIDGDILTYQSAFGAQDRESGQVFSFNMVEELLDKAVADICMAVGATEEPTIYLTGGINFRDAIAKTKPYKGNRVQEKPFHYKNIRAHLQSYPNVVMTDGIEADDAMSIAQTANVEEYLRTKAEDHIHTVICTRDKDLRMVPGFHYGWEHHLQPEFHLQWVDELGWLKYDEVSKKLSGTGFLFFCSQLITGDSTDNVPGLPKKGPKKAYETLHEATSEEEALRRTKALYSETVGEDWELYMREQGQLLWMVRKLNEDGSPVMWEIPWQETK